MMVWIFYEIVVLIRRFLSHLIVGLEDKPADDEMRPGLKSLLTDIWFYLDAFNYVLFSFWIVVRISLISMLSLIHI